MPDSAINQFFDLALPLDRPFRERWTTELSKARKQRGSAVSPLPRIDGTAIELLIACDLAPPPKMNLLDGPETSLAATLLDRLESMPEEHPSFEGIVRQGFDFGDPPEDEALLFCRQLGNFLDMYRVLRKHQPPPTGKQIAAWWRALTDNSVLQSDLQSLRVIWNRYARYGRPELLRLGGPVLISPVFAEGLGVGDMIAGKTLVDIKLSQRAEDYLTRWLRQIVGYALADHDDRHGIELVGIYHAAEAWLISWELKDLLEQLSIEPTSVSLMRDRFRVAMDREIARVAERT